MQRLKRSPKPSLKHRAWESRLFPGLRLRAGPSLMRLLALEEAGADVDALYKIKQKVVSNDEIEKEYDVIVIGGGGAGLTAAVEAAQNGANVVVLEKQSSVGGNTMISGGEMAAPNNSLQKEKGIEDSPDLLYEDMLKGGDNESDPELVRVIADHALEDAIWLEEEVGGMGRPHVILRRSLR